MVTEKMIEAAVNRLGKYGVYVGASAIKDALEAALSTDAEPVGWHIPGSTAITKDKDVTDRWRLGNPSTVINPVFSEPPAPGVVVKALEWNLNDSWNVSKTVVGTYVVRPCLATKFAGQWLLRRAQHEDSDKTLYASEDEAKAIAQADYEARIRSALSAQVQDVAESPAIKAITAERNRQIEKEGWTPEHDDTHSNGEMAWAAAAYAIGLYSLSGRVQLGKQFKPWLKRIWPWELKWWKPTSRQRNLIKAGALIVAELDRLFRAAASSDINLDKPADVNHTASDLVKPAPTKLPKASAEILSLIDQAKARGAAMTTEEWEAMYDAQRESFARGMATPCEHGVLDFEQCAECRKGGDK